MQHREKTCLVQSRKEKNMNSVQRSLILHENYDQTVIEEIFENVDGEFAGYARLLPPLTILSFEETTVQGSKLATEMRLPVWLYAEKTILAQRVAFQFSCYAAYETAESATTCNQ